jgi:hypothetical protein
VTIDAHDGSGSRVVIRQYQHIMSSDYATWDNNDGVTGPTDLAVFATGFWGGGNCC